MRGCLVLACLVSLADTTYLQQLPDVPFLRNIAYTYRYYYTYGRNRNSILVQMRWNEAYTPVVHSRIDLSEFDGINWQVTKVEKKEAGNKPQAILTLETRSVNV